MNHEAHEGSTTKRTKGTKGMEKLGSYNILEQLPTRGAGDVFRARDTVHGRTVLIRLMPPRVAEDAQLRERLITDARAAAILSHPNIQALFEIGEDGPHLFLVFEFIPGQTLRKVIGGRPLNVRNAIDIAGQLADALAEAHAQGFVHGDIKPENIRMNAKGQAKILEFGLTGWTAPSLASRPHLAKLAGPHPRSRLLLEASLDSSGAPPPLGPQALTRSSHPSAAAALGAPAQQPQALSQPPAPDLGRPIPDPRSPAPDSDQDLASLGAVVYEMLTGRPPSAKPGAPSTLNRDIPRELDAIVLRAITAKPDQRYRSGAALSAELRSVAAILDIRSGDREPPSVLRRNSRVMASGARRPAGKARRPRISGIFEGGATPPDGMPRPEDGTGFPAQDTRVAQPVPAPRRTAFRRGWLAVIVLLAVVGGALWWSLSDRLSSLWQRWAGPVPDPVVLVAPLEVAEPQRQYWSGGLAHDLAMRLGQIPGLTVVGRTGFDARREGDTARWTLRPQALLTGALDFQDGRVLLDVQLLDLRDRRALWTDRYASETSAILATQTEIAEEVARALRLSLEPSPARARKKSQRVSEGSYELYLRGRDRAAAGDAAGALEFYEQAAVDGEAFAELDGAYADALYQALSEGGPGDPRGAQARLRETATRAAAADPDLPQAALAQAMASASFEESLEHVRRALELDPSLGAAYRLVAHLLIEIDSERALRFAERALELDPGSVSAALDLVNAEARLDRFDEAERSLDSLRDRLPGRGAWAARLAMLRFEQAQHEAGLQAVADAGEVGRRPMLALVTISARHQTGGAEQARALTAELTRATPAFCEARAIEVGLQLDAGDRRAARVGAERLIGEADAADAPPRALGCAAMAAAGIHDAASAAALLRRVAQSNVALRAWLFQINGVSVQTLFRRGWYPWDLVARDPDVASAAAAIEQRIGEWRNSVAGLLDELLEWPRISVNR